MLPTSAQLRAARLHLNLTSEDVTKATEISRSSLYRMENNRAEMHPRAIRDLTAFYESKGVEFGENNWVRLPNV